MLRWAQYLKDAPVVLQRLIAATHHVNISHHADEVSRLAALRRAICRPAAVRSQYFLLPVEAQRALQILRSRRGTLSPAAAEQILGPIRPIHALRFDRRPQTIGETLVLLGWLLPRPQRPHHPAGWVLAPELRRWLPKPLPTPGASVSLPPVSPLAIAPALVATCTILIAAAEHPLPIRQSCLFTGLALRRLRALAPQYDSELWQWLLPLLIDVHLLQPTHATVVPGPVFQSFFRMTLEQKLKLLQTAWEHQPRTERWLTRLRVSVRGLDWPALRRRLLCWGMTATSSGIPANTAFATLYASFGPLVDGTTHCLAPIRRTPWTYRSQQRVWQAAVAGPLAWLGVFAPTETPPVALSWHYDAQQQQITIPIAMIDNDLVIVQPWMKFVGADQSVLRWQIDARSIRRAMTNGESPTGFVRIWQNRFEQDVPVCLPADSAPRVHITTRTVLMYDPHTVIDAAIARQSSACHSPITQIAPGLALVTPGRELDIVRALEQAGITTISRFHQAASCQFTSFPSEFDPHDCPEGLHLRIQSPALFTTVLDSWITEAVEPVSPPVRLTDTVQQLHKAIRRREALVLYYQAPQRSAGERLVQPLRIEQHGDRWFLYAYCTTRRAERCFRIDRILCLTRLSRSGLSRQPSVREQRRLSPSGNGGGRLAPSQPPSTADGQLLRIWMEES